MKTKWSFAASLLLLTALGAACSKSSKNANASANESACTLQLSVVGGPAGSLCEYIPGFQSADCLGLGGVSSAGCATTGLVGCCSTMATEDGGPSVTEVQCFYYDAGGTDDAAGTNCSPPGTWSTTVPSGA